MFLSLLMLLRQSPLQHAPHNLASVEIFLRQRARQLTLPRVIGHDLFHAADRLGQIAEPKHPGPVRQNPAWTGVLDDGGLATGEIANRAVANPCILEPDARRFDATE